jgi:hypothetical protein
MWLARGLRAARMWIAHGAGESCDATSRTVQWVSRLEKGAAISLLGYRAEQRYECEDISIARRHAVHRFLNLRFSNLWTMDLL